MKAYAVRSGYGGQADASNWSRSSWRHGLVRIDTPLDLNDPQSKITVVKDMTSQGAVEAEVSRLNQVNTDMSCTYFYCTSRLVEQAQ